MPADSAAARTPRTLNAADAPYSHSYLAIVERLGVECAAPLAAIVHVEAERLWLRAAVGFPAREMPRRSAFGDLVASCEGLSVIEDTAADERFATRPLTAMERPVRFYAAAPLALHEGSRVGVLCMLDVVPRRFTLAEARHLRWLAGRAMILMNVQKAVEQVAYGRSAG